MLNDTQIKYLYENLQFWNDLSEIQKKDISEKSYLIEFKKGEEIYSGEKECLGLVIIKSGQVRAYINSPEGKQISLYGLLPLDVCIMSASCMIKNMNFNISIESEKDCSIIIIPTSIFNKINETNLAVKNFTLELVSARFSEAMWVFEQYVFGSAAKRLASFLLQQANLENSDTLNLTHEFIANDIGTAREVITRLLKHFSNDEIVSLGRGFIKILSYEKLDEIAN